MDKMIAHWGELKFEFDFNNIYFSNTPNKRKYNFNNFKDIYK